MRVARVSRMTAAGVLVAGVLAACGGDDGGEAGEDTGDGGSAGASSAECATEATATFPTAGEIDLEGGAAVKLADSAYTIYAGDFAVAPDRISGASAEDGQHLVTLAITTFNATEVPPALEEGQTIDYTSEFGVLTFSVILNEGTTPVGNNAGASGTVEVVSVDDSAICVDVDYSDDEKSVVGTIAATIV